MIKKTILCINKCQAALTLIKRSCIRKMLSILLGCLSIINLYFFLIFEWRFVNHYY